MSPLYFQTFQGMCKQVKGNHTKPCTSFKNTNYYDRHDNIKGIFKTARSVNSPWVTDYSETVLNLYMNNPQHNK